MRAAGEASVLGGIVIVEIVVVVGNSMMSESDERRFRLKEPRLMLTMRVLPVNALAADAAKLARSGVLRISEAAGRRMQ